MSRSPLTLAYMTPRARAAATEAGVPAALVLAIAQHESGGFFPDARRGEPHLNDSSHGLMQLLLATARGAGYSGYAGEWSQSTRSGTGLYDPVTNLRYGAKHLRSLLNATGGDVERAVSAYNAGLGNAKKSTVTTRFCSVWKPTAPATGRLLDRDCERIRIVPAGEWPNQDYVDVIMRYYREHAERLAQLDAIEQAAKDSVGSGGGSRPAGGVPSSGPSSSPSGPSSVFVVRAGVAVLAAAVGAILWLLRRGG